ncbi:MAG: hypothetical protein ACKKMP_00865 [Candidatus Nealsonbacteria bacterium]
METNKEKNNKPDKEEQESQEKPQPTPKPSDPEIENRIDLNEPSQNIKKKGK